MVLIAASQSDLQALLDITAAYATRWRYTFNAAKSFVLVFGESTRSRSSLRAQRHWSLGSQVITECDEIKHLGILHTVHPSSLVWTLDRCSAGRSAFYSLFPLAPRAGGVHPLVSYRLYSAICVPIFLYGSELWDISSRQLLLLERAHRKILRTLMGLPARCRVSALLGLLGARSFASLISQRQLSFIHSFSLMSIDALSRCVLALCLANHGRSSVLHTWSQLLRRHSLPDIDEILASSIFVYGWRRYVRSHLVAESHAVVSTECSHLPLGHCLVPGRPIPHWGITLSSVNAIY